MGRKKGSKNKPKDGSVLEPVTPKSSVIVLTKREDGVVAKPCPNRPECYMFKWYCLEKCKVTGGCSVYGKSS